MANISEAHGVLSFSPNLVHDYPKVVYTFLRFLKQAEDEWEYNIRAETTLYDLREDVDFNKNPSVLDTVFNFEAFGKWRFEYNLNTLFESIQETLDYHADLRYLLSILASSPEKYYILFDFVDFEPYAQVFYHATIHVSVSREENTFSTFVLSKKITPLNFTAKDVVENGISALAYDASNVMEILNCNFYHYLFEQFNILINDEVKRGFWMYYTYSDYNILLEYEVEEFILNFIRVYKNYKS
ncbi:hypothetical protein CBA00_14600, partial [Listeria monocytogenes]|nr:hypothetical protein [Listeria monocytogenes]